MAESISALVRRIGLPEEEIEKRISVLPGTIHQIKIRKMKFTPKIATALITLDKEIKKADKQTTETPDTSSASEPEQVKRPQVSPFL